MKLYFIVLQNRWISIMLLMHSCTHILLITLLYSLPFMESMKANPISQVEMEAGMKNMKIKEFLKKGFLHLRPKNNESTEKEKEIFKITKNQKKSKRKTETIFQTQWKYSWSILKISRKQNQNKSNLSSRPFNLIILPNNFTEKLRNSYLEKQHTLVWIQQVLISMEILDHQTVH